MDNETLKKHLYVRDEKNWEMLCLRKALSERELTVTKVEQGILLPPRNIPNDVMDIFEGGICDKELNFVAGSIRIHPRNPGYLSVIRSYDVPKDQLTFCHEDVIYGGVLIGHFGHFMLEAMVRFWYILEHPEDRRKIVFLNFYGWHSWMDDFFDLLSIDRSRFLIIDKPTQFLSVTIPEESAYCLGMFYTKEYILPYDIIKKHVAQHPAAKKFPSKIYLGRHQYHSMVTCLNENYFENYFQARGFTVIAPEQHPLAEQIQFVLHSDEIACSLGTLSHFALFCRPETKFIMLVRTDDQIVPHQCLVNQASGVDWYIVDTSMNFLYGDRISGVLLMGATLSWKRFALDYFGDTIEDNTLKDFCYDYLRNWCQWAAQPKSLKELDDMDVMELFQQFYRNIMGQEPPESCPKHSPKKLALQSRIKELERKLASAENLLSLLPEPPHLAKYVGKLKNGERTPFCYQGQDCGDSRKGTPLTGISITFTTENISGGYQVYHPQKGWSEVFPFGTKATNEDGLPLFGMRILLEEKKPKRYSISYQLHNSLHGWSPEVHPSDAVSTNAAPMDAFRVKLIYSKRNK